MESNLTILRAGTRKLGYLMASVVAGLFVCDSVFGEPVEKEIPEKVQKGVLHSPVIPSTSISSQKISPPALSEQPEAAPESVATQKVLPMDNSEQQNIEITPGTIPKERKPYVSPDNTVYWPMDRPFWLQLATASGDSAETFSLSKIQNVPKADSKEMFKKGIQLEIPGNQFVRWMNYYTQKETLYRFVADSGPPQVRLDFGTSVKAPSQTEVIYGGDVQISLSGEDEHSGVRYLAYSINDLKFVRYGAPLHFTEGGTYKFQYYGLDNVGYTSNFQGTQFKVDAQAPTTSFSRKTGAESKVLGPRDQIVLQGQDNLAGVKSTYYRFGKDSEYHVYTNPIPLTSLPEGNQLLSYFSKDHVNNQEKPQEAAFYMCRSAPDITHKFLGDLFINGTTTYISPRTKVQLNVDENHSKVKEVTYKVENSSFNAYKDPFHLSPTPVAQTVSYQVKDEFDNISPAKSVKVVIDSQPPKTGSKFEGPVYAQSSDVFFISEKTKMMLPATDDSSGVLNTYLQIGDTPASVFGGVYSSSIENKNRMRYWSSDKVNNRESNHAILVVVDRTPPDILVAFSNDPLRLETKEVQINKTYAIGSSILVSAVDNLSGVNEIKVAVDNGVLKKYDGPIPFTEQKLYSVTIVVSDRVGNQNKKTVQFNIKEHINKFEIVSN